jgi:hypothetical protein
MDSALDGADGDRIGYEIRLQARLDDKQATDLLKHRHGKANAEQMAPFRPFPIKDSG